MVLLNVVLSEIGRIRIAQPSETHEQEYIACMSKVTFRFRNMIILQLFYFFHVKEYDSVLDRLKVWLECLKGTVVMIPHVICPSDDNLDQREILGHAGIHVVLVVSQEIYEILKSIFIEIVKCEIKELKTGISFVVSHVDQVVTECFVLLKSRFRPIMQTAIAPFEFMEYFKEPQRFLNFGLRFGFVIFC